jgi:hypothetical protein
MKEARRAATESGGAAGIAASWLPTIAILGLHLTFATTYGIFRDELYYLSCAARLDWGYVDHPPLVALLTAIWTALFGDSLFALRALPALAVAGATGLVAATARRLGGGPFAVTLAALAYGLAPVVLSLGSVLSMNAFDLLFWAALARVLVSLLDDGDERLWLAFGALAGLGLQNKISVLFCGFGLVVGLVVARRWEPFRSRWFWAGGALAALLFLPHLVWQQLHGWPTREFIENASRWKNVEYSIADFLREQLLNGGPVNALVWLSGLGALLLAKELGRFRALGWVYLAVLALLLTTAAKPYYLAPAYAALFAAGGVTVERATAAWRGRGAIRWGFLAVLVATALAIAPLARPMLPVERYVAYAAALGETPGTDERKEVGRLKQFYADMQEWRELAEAVGRAAAKLTPQERAAACVFGQNYGEAGAVEYFGRELELPPAISAHNSWYLWGPGDCANGEALLVMAGDRDRLEELFADVEPGAIFDCRDCMPYEDRQTIWIVRDPKVGLDELWPRIKNFS